MYRHILVGGKFHKVNIYIGICGLRISNEIDFGNAVGDVDVGITTCVVANTVSVGINCRQIIVCAGRIC